MTADYRFNSRGVRKIDVRLSPSHQQGEEPYGLMFMSTITDECLRVNMTPREAIRLRDSLIVLTKAEG